MKLVVLLDDAGNVDGPATVIAFCETDETFELARLARPLPYRARMQLWENACRMALKPGDRVERRIVIIGKVKLE